MRTKKIIISIITVLLINNSFAQNATFTDYGFIPDSGVSIISEFQTSVNYNGDILIATTKGVWKNNIATQVWENIGLQDKKITFIYKHPAIPDKLYAGALLDGNNSDPLFISNDGGLSWTAADNAAETFLNIVARPGYPNHLYAGMYDNPNIMVSTDGGNNWVYYNNGSGGLIGYPVCLIFLPANGNQLFVGTENPLDDARIDRYDINASDPTQLDNWITIVDNSVWSNRRPNKLHTYSYTGNNLYVGQEGSFSKVNTNNINDVTFIYKSATGGTQQPYTYMYGHWTDPDDTNHLVFGGNINGSNAGLMQLYETYNEGTTFHRYTDTFGVSAPMVKDIVEINSNKLAVIISEQFNDSVKLIVMEPLISSIKDQISIQEKVSIYPNPANSYIIINSQLKNREMTIKIYNSLGQLMKSQISKSANSVLFVNEFPKGTYFISINIDNKIITKKVVLK